VPGKGRPFTKGQSGNPNGGPKLPQSYKRARALTRHELVIVLSKYMNMTAEELKAAHDDPKTTVLEGIVIAVVRAAIIEGCSKRLDFLLDRLIGKVPVKTDATHTFNLSSMPRAQAIELGKEAVAFLEQQEKSDED
jgi:hypothetical protein